MGFFFALSPGLAECIQSNLIVTKAEPFSRGKWFPGSTAATSHRGYVGIPPTASFQGRSTREDGVFHSPEEFQTTYLNRPRSLFTPEKVGKSMY